MANDFLTAQEIAQESLLRLQNNLVMRELVFTDNEEDFADKGDTVQVKKPATFEADEFDGSTNSQDVDEDKVLVEMDKIADVSVDITSKELSLNIQDFGEQVAEGAMQAIAQKVDADIMQLYKDVPYVAGTIGETPSELADIAQARKVLNQNKAPLNNRAAVWGPDAEANLLTLDAIVNADKSGDTDALREANMGRVMGFDNFMSQNVVEHEKGDLEAGGSNNLQVESEVSEGDYTVTVGSSGSEDLSGSIKAGDLISFDGVDGYWAVAEDNDPDTADTISIEVTTSLPAIDAETEVTVEDNRVANLGFHRNAFAFVNRPMALPMGGAEGAIETYQGLTIRVTMGYEMNSKENTISWDILYGTKVLQPELAVVIQG